MSGNWLNVCVKCFLLSSPAFPLTVIFEEKNFVWISLLPCGNSRDLVSHGPFREEGRRVTDIDNAPKLSTCSDHSVMKVLE